MRQIAEFVAVFACGIFTGAAAYVSLVEHPARMECGVEIVAAEFSPSYRRGSVMQASWKLVSFGASARTDVDASAAPAVHQNRRRVTWLGCHMPAILSRTIGS